MDYARFDDMSSHDLTDTFGVTEISQVTQEMIDWVEFYAEKHKECDEGSIVSADVSAFWSVGRNVIDWNRCFDLANYDTSNTYMYTSFKVPNGTYRIKRNTRASIDGCIYYFGNRPHDNVGNLAIFTSCEDFLMTILQTKSITFLSSSHI